MRTSSPYNQDLFKFKKAEDAFENVKFRDLAIENHLYVDGWALLEYLEDEFQCEDDYIALCFYDGIPVGLCLCMDFGLTMFYVKESFRRLGIGKELLRCFEDKSKKYAFHGIKGSEIFFEQVGLQMRQFE